jgi:GAF domain-containing protein
VNVGEALAGSPDGALDRAAQTIADSAPHFTGVYLYVLDGDALQLAGFHGRPSPHTRIGVGHGICGAAVASGSDIEVPDVAAEPRYLACNSQTRSELVVLVRHHGDIVGQIDIDSDELDPFTAHDHAQLREAAGSLGPVMAAHTMRPRTS